MKLRSHLILLAFGTIVPVAVFATAAAAWLVDKERETVLAGAGQRAQTLLTAIEAELRGHLATLDGLAAPPSLEDGDVPYFRRAISNVLASQRDWLNVSLLLPDGRIVADGTGAEGGRIAPDDAFDRVVRMKRSQVGAVALHPAIRKWQFPVYAPVVQAGALRYVVAANVSTVSIDELIAIQKLGEGWGAVVLDGNNRFVARNWNSAKYVGQPASESLQEALRRAPSGMFRGRTEGIEVYSPYHRSKATGWTVSMGIPANHIDDASNRTAWLLLSGVLLSISLALAGAYVISRRIATPLTQLAGAAEAIGEGKTADIPREARVDEIRTLAHVLESSARAAHEREDALRDADRAKDRFLAMLSHELRNPLASISAASHVLKVARPDTANAIKARLVIERQTRHMAHLINDLLDISRVTMGKMALDRERLDFGDLVARVVSIWRTSGRFERHSISVDARQVWVYGDRVRLEQIVNNLLDNALKFTPIGRGIRVAVREEQGEALLEVADEGSGIPPALLEELFKPFVQGSEPGAHAAAGLGIGLSLVKGLVQMHGGSVSAANDERHRGAVFTVRLPAVAPQAANEEPHPAALGGRRILIIEDDDDTRSMLHAAFELGGHQVRGARDGTTGLALAAETPPDVAIIDIGLPDMDGIEVARRLRSEPRSRRINLVALTGFGGSEDQRRALEAGFDVHLTKPVTQERLKRVIGDLK